MYLLLQPHVLGLQTESVLATTMFKDNWTFESAIVFSFTIVTTIGYGTFTPTTGLGRIFLVVYALIGIPIAGIALAFIAERALYIFTFLSQVGSDTAIAAFNQFDDDASGELDKNEFKEACKLLGYDLNPHQFGKWKKTQKKEINIKSNRIYNNFLNPSFVILLF